MFFRFGPRNAFGSEWIKAKTRCNLKVTWNRKNKEEEKRCLDLFLILIDPTANASGKSSLLCSLAAHKKYDVIVGVPLRR